MRTTPYTDDQGHIWYPLSAQTTPGAPVVGDLVAYPVPPGGGTAAVSRLALPSSWAMAYSVLGAWWYLENGTRAALVRRPTQAELAAYRLTQGG